MASALSNSLNERGRLDDESNSHPDHESPSSTDNQCVQNHQQRAPTESPLTPESPLSPQRPSRSTLIPLPAFCESPQCQRIWKIFKYVYVGTAFVAFTLLLVLENLIPAVKDAVAERQEKWIDFALEDELGTLYLLLFIAFVTICKSIGISDVLSLRTMAVAILYWKLLPNHNGWSTFLCMMTLGLLSSISHLLEYKLIGAELQDVQGRPIELMLPWLRKLFLLCLKEEQMEWLDFEWTFNLSEMTRHNEQLDIVTNLDQTLTALVAKQCRRQCPCCTNITGKDDGDHGHDHDGESVEESPYFKESDSNNPNGDSLNGLHLNESCNIKTKAKEDKEEEEEEDRNHNNNKNNNSRNNNKNRCTGIDSKQNVSSSSSSSSRDENGCSIPRLTRLSWQCLLYLLASIWAGCMEWIIPISEFLMYAHNWDFSIRNAVVVVLMELCDIDRIVETYIIFYQLRCCNDPFGGKQTAVWMKPVFYVLGYVVILPLTLMWYKTYYEKLTRDISKKPHGIGVFPSVSVPVATVSRPSESTLNSPRVEVNLDDDDGNDLDPNDVISSSPNSKERNGSDAIFIETTHTSQDGIVSEEENGP